MEVVLRYLKANGLRVLDAGGLNFLTNKWIACVLQKIDEHMFAEKLKFLQVTEINWNAKHSQNEICLVLFLKLDKTHLIFFLAIVENSVGKCDWGWAIVVVSPSNWYQVKRKTLTEVLL